MIPSVMPIQHSLIHRRPGRIKQSGHFILNDSPDDGVVDRLISMHDDVAKGEHLREIAKTSRRD